MIRIRFRNLIFSCSAIALVVLALSPQASAQFAIVGGRPALNPDAQKALQKQLRQAFEPMLKVELSFACRVAKPTDTERDELIGASATWLDDFVKEFMTKQDQNEQQMWMQGMRQVVIGGAREAADPHQLIQQSVAKLVAETLPAEKAAAYKSESEKRLEFYREAIVANLVVQLDDKLTLSPVQRKKISTSLFEKWDEKWPPQIESFAYSSNYFLPSPREVVRPELSESQRAVFDQLNRTSQRMIVGAAGFGAGEMEIIDDVQLQKEPAADVDQQAAEKPVAVDAVQIQN